MKIVHLALIILLTTTGLGLCKEAERSPVDEDGIVAEMDRIVDASGPVNAKDMEKATKYYRQGIEAHDAHQYERAIEMYGKAVKLTPTRSTLYYEIALSYTMVGDQTMALENIIRAIALDPGSEQAYVLKGSILDDLGYSDAAIATYDRLLEVMPDSYQGLVNKGITYARHKEWARAEETLKLAVDAAPELPSAYFHLATVAGNMGFNYEQEAYLKKFLEVGQNDRRRESVERTLQALSNYDVALDRGDRFGEIVAIEKLARAQWRAIRHRELFPEARGYSLSYEEERTIYEDLLIPTWRRQKLEDPEASDPRFDTLLKVADAGFLEEYIYLLRREEFGDPGREWLQAHSDRIAEFSEWAVGAGISIPGEQREAGDAGKESDVVQLTAVVMAFAEQSTLTYNIEDGDDERTKSYLEAERKLFNKKVKLKGDDRIKCSDIIRRLDEAAYAASTLHLHVEALRCFVPDDPEWRDAEMRLSRSGLMMRDLGWSPNGSIESSAEGASIGVKDSSTLFYLMAKATWKNEQQLRLRYRGPEEYEPSLLEEYFAVSTAVQAYINMRNAALQETEAMEESPLFETLIDVAERDLIEGYVLFEVLHKLYGISLASLDTDDAAAIDRYLRTYVLKVVDRTPGDADSEPE